MDKYLYNYLYICCEKNEEGNDVQMSRYILNLIINPYYVHSAQACRVLMACINQWIKCSSLCSSEGSVGVGLTRIS